MKKEEYKYKFSVVIPVYKVEKYLEETILSVINQDMRFKDDIQIILVNDGSPDKSKEICLKYSKMYPNNIIYVEQENAGVSAARNNGMQYIKGKYTNFLDSDDTWSTDSFRKVYNFFEKHYDSIDMVACRMKFFGKINGFSHALDYKFKSDGIVNIKENRSKIQLSVTSAFFKTSAIRNLKYDTELKYAEDAKFISELLLKSEKYGVMRSAVHNYRKREDESSAIQTRTETKDWYTKTIEKCYKVIFKMSKEKYGKVIPYFQYQIMYDLQWRLRIELGKTLSKEEAAFYLQSLKDILQEIDDYIICEQRKIPGEVKLYALTLKYGKDAKKELEFRDKNIYYKNIHIAKLYNDYFIIIRNLDIKNGNLQLEGQITCFLNNEDYNIYFEDQNGEKHYLEYYKMEHKKRKGTDRYILEPRGFKVEIPLDKVKEITAICSYRNEIDFKIKLKFAAYAKLHHQLRRSYYTKEEYIVKSAYNKIQIDKKKKNHLKYEFLYMCQLAKNKLFKVILYRILYYITGLFYKKPIWIVSDRPDMANDNGLHMFRYLVEKEKNAKVYFAVSKKSKDLNKLKSIGKVLKLETLKYKMRFLHASKIISSQANEYVISAFDKEKQFLKDLYKFNFVFLQHGIIKNDLSEWLHKQNKNISLFITSAKTEYESIINGNYAYNDRIVKLTGIPRYDELYKNVNQVKKQLVFMPTWRKDLAGKEINNLGERAYNEKFKTSKYCKFYNKLINDEKLLKCLKEHEYTGKFFIHPTLKIQAKDFKGNKYIEVSEEIADYQKEFKEGKMLITDFSSVAFDFAYLKKPVIYTQFDTEEYYKNAMYIKGYFDDKNDGFGPVCENYEETVDTIIKYIENDCKLEEKYEERINNFYYKFDNKNCERVHQEILKLDNLTIENEEKIEERKQEINKERILEEIR